MNKLSPPVLRKIAIASLLAPSVALMASTVLAQPQPLVNPFTGQPMRAANPTPPDKAAPGAPEPAGNTPLSTLLGTHKPAPPTPGATPPPAAAPTPTAKPASQDTTTTSTPAPSTPTGNTAPPSGAELSNTPNPGVTLKFDNADIYDVLQVVLGDILKLDYIIDPSVQGRITLKSTGAISMADIFSALETALSTSNIAIVRQGKTYKVLRDATAVRDSVGKQGVGPASMVMQIIPLRFVQANQLVNTLRNFVGPQAAITNDAANKHLIVTDRQANVDKIIEMVKTLDVDYFNHVQIKLLPIEHAEANDMAKEIDGLFKTSGLFNWAGTDASKVYVLPVVRMNALLVATANDKLMQAAEQWVKTLDAEPRNGLGAYVHVYPVVNSNAQHLSGILQQLFGGTAAPASNAGASTLPSANSSAFGNSSGGAAASLGSSGTGSTANAAAAGTTRTIERGGNVPSAQGSTGTSTGLGGSVQVIADEVTNSLIIRASAQDYQQIRKVLERLDSVPRQVLIQVMVAEVTLTDTLQYGVEWWLKSALSYNGKSWPGFVGLEGAIKPNVSSASGATPAVAGSGSGLNYAIFGSAGQVIGMLNLLGQDTDVNILSTPHVLASDGKIAKVEVGDEIPVITQTVSTPSSSTLLSSSFSTSNSVQYRPTGILLEVKPSITSSGNVSLSISQEVSSVGNPVSTGGSEYPSFSKRKVTTDVTIENGKTIMLAGLIQNKGNNVVTGVPGFKDIPVLGGLFGSTKKVRDKTELLITITPYIVTNRAEGERLTGSFQESLQKLRGMLLNNSTTPALNSDALPASAFELPTAKPQSVAQPGYYAN